jgi:hypothetical protein
LFRGQSLDAALVSSEGWADWWWMRQPGIKRIVVGLFYLADAERNGFNGLYHKSAFRCFEHYSD